MTRRPDLLGLGAAALLVGAALPSCAGIEHSIDDIKCVHTQQSISSKDVPHKFDVERYSWLTAQTIWGFLRWIPGISEQAERSSQHLSDPASFCFHRVGDLLEVDVTNIPQAAEVVFWSGGIVMGDPFPLSRIRALGVLRKVVSHYRPSLDLLSPSDPDVARKGAALVNRLSVLETTTDETRTPELTQEYIRVARELGRLPFELAKHSRAIGDELGRDIALTSDVELQTALSESAAILMVRGALQQMVEALDINKESHEQVRIAAARELTAALGAPAVELVIQMLGKDTDPTVRAAVAEIAGKQWKGGGRPPDAVVAYLTTAAGDHDNNVAVVAMESLGILTGVGRQFDPDWWKRWQFNRLLEKREVP